MSVSRLFFFSILHLISVSVTNVTQKSLSARFFFFYNICWSVKWHYISLEHRRTVSKMVKWFVVKPSVILWAHTLVYSFTHKTDLTHTYRTAEKHLHWHSMRKLHFSDKIILFYQIYLHLICSKSDFVRNSKHFPIQNLYFFIFFSYFFEWSIIMICTFSAFCANLKI